MLVGVICPADGSYQSFESCLRCHEIGGDRACHAPTQVIKIMQNNHIGRQHAGWSASMMTNCARSVALQESYDYYESVETGYNKARGEWVHAMIESDETPRPGLIREKRIAKSINVLGKPRRITGKPDEVDTERGLLIDYKSKHLLPKKPDPKHEVQFNLYAWLLSGGFFVNPDGTDGEQVNVSLRGGGMHYITWNTKKETLWKKMSYPLWPTKKTEELLKERLTPLVQWKDTGELPNCNAYIKYSKMWKCDCVSLEQQLNDRGIYV